MAFSILVIDDSRVARQLIVDTLRESGLCETFYEAANGREGFEQLCAQPVDVVLCDLEMPGSDGFSFLALIGAREELRDIPVIMLTGHECSDKKVRGLEKGASDYVTKPFEAAELIARVKVQLKIKALQDSLRESNRQLERLSLTDHLTGLANRRHFTTTLEREFGHSQRTGVPLALVLLDIDHFKKINDTFGHQQGDEVLAALAGLLQRSLRPYDLAARYGGEEFALILPETGLPLACQVAARLREEVERLAFGGVLEKLRLTASFGVAGHPGGSVTSAERLFAAADAALYRAKQGGRNLVEVMAG